ncbi:MAG: 5'-nucleotidase [Firmicutes bacterium ADurb.Bin300]|nr:MAG: 5'-nucleotidase [Firmicutes bacterium ADurb.Bin300]
MKEYDYYLFDFDGTIMDTERSIKSCVIYALNFFGINEDNPDNLDGFIGPPLFQSFKRYYGVSDELANSLILKYRERYAQEGCLDCSVYDGIPEVLRELKNRGKKIAIASSKPIRFVEKISKHFGLYEYFDAVCAESFDEINSGKKLLIEKALDMLGCKDKSKAVMVGDRYLDIEGALKVGIDSAGAVFGFGTKEELENAGATWLIFNSQELLKFKPE